MLEKGDLVLVDYQPSRIHRKPCIVLSSGIDWNQNLYYVVSPLDENIQPREWDILANQLIYANPFTLIELLENIGQDDWKEEVIQKFNLKLGGTHEQN